MRIDCASIALAMCTWLLCQGAIAQTYVNIASTPEGCHIYISGKDFIAEGCNVHVRDASGYTWCDHLNATPPTTDNCDNTGNLVIGWNEDTTGTYARNGNHNLVVGDEHNYTAYGAFVAGYQNDVAGPYTSVSGGYNNRASGERASICGGVEGDASGPRSTIVGGIDNETTSTGHTGTILGGSSNVVSGSRATVVGGGENIVAAHDSTVLGGVGGEPVPYETLVADLVLATGSEAMPANGSGYTTIPANSRVGTYQISFNQTMPCVPVVTTQMFNSGGNQVAPFILSINSITATSFNYYLINPSGSSQSAYTATIYWTAICL